MHHRCHDTVALSWWTNSSNSVFREMSLPRTAEAAVITNLSSTGDNNKTLAHYVQINLKSSGNIVVQGETRSFTDSDLNKFKETLAVIGAKADQGSLRQFRLPSQFSFQQQFSETVERLEKCTISWGMTVLII